MNLRENVPLGPITTFGIGGSARWFVEAAGEADIREAVSFAKSRNIPFIVLAGCSNVLIADEGLDALVIHLGDGGYQFFETGLRADAGCNLLALIRAAAERALGGWEKLSGIPGTIGGAVRGNAGAFGSEIKDFVSRVTAFNAATLEGRVWVAPYLAFSYRDSPFKREADWIITGVTVELASVKREASVKLIEETIAERERRHIQNVRAAGSFFLNPTAPPAIVAQFEKEKKLKSREGRVPAGWLIEKAGLKGYAVGGAIASLQHPNYLVNAGGATATDVLAVAAKIKEEVRRQFDIELKEEAAVFHH